MSSSGENKGGGRGDAAAPAAANKDNARASVCPTRGSGREREGLCLAREGKGARESDEGNEKEDGAGGFVGRFRVLVI